MIHLHGRKWPLVLIIVSALIFTIILDFFGIIWHNSIFVFNYEVKGLDVSSHQGKIDWKSVAQTNRYKFAFIKATEGHDFIDDNFDYNWRNAKENGLLVGAYHFFSKRSPGSDQAKEFIKIVPVEESSLPHVIDIEIDTNLNPEQIRQEIKTFSDELEKHYLKKPILYVTYDTYNAYIKDYFQDYYIWFRDVLKPPMFIGRKWNFWQYNNRGRVKGVEGFVDINVFKGNLNDLRNIR